MKVLYVIPYPKFFSQHRGVGGHVAHCVGIVNAMYEKNFDVYFFGEEIVDLLKNKIKRFKIIPKRKITSFRCLWSFVFLKKLEKEIKEINPDIIYMRYSASMALWYFLVKRIIGNHKLILEVNSLGSQHRPILKFFDYRMLRLANKIVCISETLGSYILNQLKLDIVVVPNGIDENRIPQNMIESISHEKRDFTKIVYAGLLKPNYGLEFSIKALDLVARKKNIEFVLYGDGPLVDVLRNMAKTRPWLNVLGPIPFEKVPLKLISADILLYPTDTFNKFQSPIKIFEYMAAAQPIVSAKTNQTNQILEKGRYGYLFELNNSESFRKTMIDAINNPEVAKKKAIAARKEVLKKHTWSSRLEMIIK